MACDDEVIPLQERIEAVSDDADLQEVYDTERHLLCVACTRARDQLLVTAADPASKFLDDIPAGGPGRSTWQLSKTGVHAVKASYPPLARVETPISAGSLCPTFAPPPTKTPPQGWRKSLILLWNLGGRCRV